MVESRDPIEKTWELTLSEKESWWRILSREVIWMFWYFKSYSACWAEHRLYLWQQSVKSERLVRKLSHEARLKIKMGKTRWWKGLVRDGWIVHICWRWRQNDPLKVRHERKMRGRVILRYLEWAAEGIHTELGGRLCRIFRERGRKEKYGCEREASIAASCAFLLRF